MNNDRSKKQKRQPKLTKKEIIEYMQQREVRTREIAREEIEKWWNQLSKNKMSTLDSRRF
jgi:hypothetical protein